MFKMNAPNKIIQTLIKLRGFSFQSMSFNNLWITRPSSSGFMGISVRADPEHFLERRHSVAWENLYGVLSNDAKVCFMLVTLEKCQNLTLSLAIISLRLLNL